MNFDFTTCDIFPKIGVVKKASKAEKKAGGVASITNNDPNILHNPHGYSVVGANRKTLFNKPSAQQRGCCRGEQESCAI